MLNKSTFAPPKDGFHPDKLKIEIASIEAQTQLEQGRLKNDIHKLLIFKLLSSDFLVFLLILLIVISAVIFMVRTNDIDKSFEYWKYIFPIIGTYMGYAFGSRNKD